MLLGAGMGIKTLGAVGQLHTLEGAKAAADRNAQIQMSQNQAQADTQDINTLRQANEMYDKGVAAAASSGASLSSGSFANNITAAYNDESNKQFINAANKNIADTNALFQANQEKQQLAAQQTGIAFGLATDAIMTGASLGSKMFAPSLKGASSGFTGIQAPGSKLSLFSM